MCKGGVEGVRQVCHRGCHCSGSGCSVSGTLWFCVELTWESPSADELGCLLTGSVALVRWGSLQPPQGPRRLPMTRERQEAAAVSGDQKGCGHRQRPQAGTP